MVNPEIAPAFRCRDDDHAACVVNAVTTAERVCKERGVRFTPLRRRVLELVWSGHRPAKAYELLEQLKLEHAGSAPPTVYRALDFLVDNGFVHRLESLNAFIGCGDAGEKHGGQFLICRECGRVAELDDPELKQLLARKAQAVGFTGESSTIEVEGLCARCAG